MVQQKSSRCIKSLLPAGEMTTELRRCMFLSNMPIAQEHHDDEMENDWALVSIDGKEVG